MPFLRLGKNAAIEESAFWGANRYDPSIPPARTCGSPECTGGWSAPWRSRRRPIFEGRWGCGGRCVLAMVRAALRREAGEAVTVDGPHRHRVPLGLLMLAQGWITHDQLRRALDAQRKHGSGRIGDWLIAECGVTDERVTRGLSMQWSCPVLTTEGFSPEQMALVMPRIFVEEFGLMPLRMAGTRILYLGFGDKMDATVALAAEQVSELQTVTGLVKESQFRAAQSRLLECEGVALKSESSPDTDSLAARITAILEQKQPVASRLVRVHGYFWMRMWLETAALGGPGTLPASGEDVMDYVFSVSAC